MGEDVSREERSGNTTATDLLEGGEGSLSGGMLVQEKYLWRNGGGVVIEGWGILLERKKVFSTPPPK